MCAIAGVISPAQPENLRFLPAMIQSMAHRGPDGEGLWTAPNNNVALAHRRLAILDLSAEAGQPFHSHDQRYVMTYNGEVYNYLELRQECETLGSRFTTTSDTEVVLECYRHWGVACFQKFHGMWALAIYDHQTRQVILARDHFGIKPLHFCLFNGALFFASEIKGLKTIDRKLRIPDEASVQLFEEHGILDRKSWTFFRDIERFPQGHYAVIDVDQPAKPPRAVPFWRPSHQTAKMTFKEAVEEFRRLFVRSVDLHLRSDVPVGSCLSGGLDSSSIVTTAARRLQGGSRLSTFTTRFPDHAHIDETAWAEKINQSVGAQSHWVSPCYEDFLEDFDRLIAAQDEPFASTSIYSQYSVFKRIGREHVKVVLDGQGADELMGGYEPLKAYFLSEWRERGRWDLIARQLFARPARVHRWSRLTATATTPPIRNDRDQEVADRLKEIRQPLNGVNDFLSDMVTDSNLPQLLRYEDRNSMAFSVESRVPFLYVPLVEFILSLPSEFKLRAGYQKAILREAVADLVPDEVRWRRNKLGFPAPEQDWLERRLGQKISSNGSPQWRSFIVSSWRQALEMES